MGRTPDFTHITAEGDIPEDTLTQAVQDGRVAIDTETSGLNWSSDRLEVIQVVTPQARMVAIVRPTNRIPQRLLGLLEDPAIEKVFHHACFDLRFMRVRWEFVPQAIACTKVISKIVNQRGSEEAHSLQSLLAQYCGVSLDKTVRLSDWGAPRLSEAQLEYAAKDVLFLSELRDRLMDRAAEVGVVELVQESCGYIPTRVVLDLLGVGDVFTY